LMVGQNGGGERHCQVSENAVGGIHNVRRISARLAQRIVVSLTVSR
jgi:hypothetical protein